LRLLQEQPSLLQTRVPLRRFTAEMAAAACPVGRLGALDEGDPDSFPPR
jgi:hypothetical protein